MVQQFIIHGHHPRLLLFFAGWGADATPFEQYRPQGSDYMVCYDYRSPAFDTSALQEYEEVNPVGWSMGVWAATQVMERLARDVAGGGLPPEVGCRGAAKKGQGTVPRVGRSIAINGTPFPVDDRRGIPTATYHGTLEGLTGVSLHKFLRRMCADSQAFRAFLEVTPRRPLEELREELAAAEAQYKARRAEPPRKRFKWNLAVVGGNDRIVPPMNQLQAWQEEGTPTVQTDDAHYSRPLFQYYLQDLWTNS
ncbi:MAG: DUF452 family protein [Prevotellaceae bacterium]|nr:DUF452 family protein [Prevotellaceae bacterium]